MLFRPSDLFYVPREGGGDFYLRGSKGGGFKKGRVPGHIRGRGGTVIEGGFLFSDLEIFSAYF